MAAMSARRRRTTNHPSLNEAAPEGGVPALEPLDPPLGRIAKLLEHWRTIAGVIVTLVLLGAGAATWAYDLVRQPALEREHGYATEIREQLGDVETRVTKVEGGQAGDRAARKWMMDAIWELLRPTGKVLPPPPLGANAP